MTSKVPQKMPDVPGLVEAMEARRDDLRWMSLRHIYHNQTVEEVDSSLTAPAVQGEPVAWQRVDRPDRIITVLSRRTWKEVEDGVEFLALYAAPQPAEETGEVVVTKDKLGNIVYVTRQDAEGRVLSVIAESDGCDGDCDAVVIGGHRAVERQSVLNLSEAARSLGVAQEKGDQGAIDYWGDMVSRFEREVTQPIEKQPDITQLAGALEQIERWDGLPSTGEVWEDSGEPVSYGAAFGSNGERDFMREVARKALAACRKGGEK